MRKVIIVFDCLLMILILISIKKDPYDKYKGRNLQLESNDKALLWFSGIHTNNPDHQVFQDIDQAFSSFESDFVLVEGSFDKNKYKVINNPEEARLYGEVSKSIPSIKRLPTN